MANKTYIRYESTFAQTGDASTDQCFYYRAIHPDGRVMCRQPKGPWFPDSGVDIFEWLPCSSREATNRGKNKPQF